MVIIINVIIITLSINWINQVFKNNYISNYYVRLNNQSFLKKLLKESYIYIFPIILAFTVCLIYIFLNTNLTLTSGVIESSNWSVNSMKNVYRFIVIYLLQLVFYLGTYVNLGLIMSRKNYNYILSIISTLLLVIGLELFEELVIDRILNIKYASYLSIVNCFAFDDRLGVFSPLLFPIVTFIITLIMVLIIYRNKEKLYLDCDKKILL